MSAPMQSARRGFLALLAGAAAAPTAAALPAVAATTAPAESPELLAIGERLPDLVARLRAARSRMDNAVSAYERTKPVVPPEIIWPERGSDSLMTLERGLDNEPVRHDDQDWRGLRYLYSARKVKAHIIIYEISRHTKEGRQLRRIARLAAKYEKDIAAAVAASGYGEARSDVITLEIELQNDFAGAALAIPPRTMTGLGIYAAIVAAGSGSMMHNGQPVGACKALALAMAEAFVAINGGGAS